MKKQIAKSLSILSLLVLLSVQAANVSAGGGTCSVPSCRPANVAAPATTPNVTKLSEQELGLSEQPADSFGFAYFLVRWAINFLY